MHENVLTIDNKPRSYTDQMASCIYWGALFGVTGGGALLAAIWMGVQQAPNGDKAAAIFVVMAVASFFFAFNQLVVLCRICAKKQDDEKVLDESDTIYAYSSRQPA